MMGSSPSFAVPYFLKLIHRSLFDRLLTLGFQEIVHSNAAYTFNMYCFSGNNR